MVTKANVKDMYSLSPMQEGMFFHYIMDRTSQAYFEQMNYRIRGHLDVVLFEQALNRLVERYDVLRTVFVYKKAAKPRQVLLKKREARIHVEDISHLSDQDQSDYITAFKTRDRETGFDLSRDMPLRISILKLSDTAYEVVWSFHHIIMDGWCTAILIKEMLEIYRHLRSGGCEPLQLPPTTPYSYYIKWLERQDKEKALQYWSDYLKGCETRVTFPCMTAHQQPHMQHKSYIFKIDSTMIRQLYRISDRNNVTLNIVFRVSWGILLQKYNNTDDVVFGAVSAGRPPGIPGIDTMVGLFINTLPVRIQREPGETFEQLLKKAQHQQVRSNEYEYIPLAEIQSLTALKRDLVNHIFTFESYPVAREVQNAGGRGDSTLNQDFKIDHFEAFEQTNYDLEVVIAPGTNELHVTINYDTGLYDASGIERIGRHLLEIAKQVAKNSRIPIKDISPLTENEKKELLYDYNDTRASYPANKTVHQLIEEKAEQIPDHIAVVHPEGQVGTRFSASNIMAVTYRELNQKSNQLAHLLQEKGVEPNAIVAITGERSIEMIIGIFSILKSGGAYLPIDPDYPEERFTYMLQDSGARILLSEVSKVSEVSGDIEVIDLIHPTHPNSPTHPSQLSQPTHLSYIIYTSGSTGKPKGVMISHQGLVNYIWWAAQSYVKDERHAFPFYTSISFDLTITSIFTPLITGNTILIYTSEQQETLVEKIIQDNRVGIIKLTPTHLKILLDRQAGPGLSIPSRVRRFIVGGEQLETRVAETISHMFGTTIEIYNEYGPTETVVGCMIHRYAPAQDTGSSVPIGVPAHNAQIYLLDKDQNPVPVGLAGELFISGDGVADGYLNRPELTAAKFLPNPFVSGKRMYRTGDLARHLPGGIIEFIGRIDFQVKIRGYRIELGEIEHTLRQHEQVSDVVVTAAEHALCAHYISETALPVSELRAYLSQHLPDPMIPSYYIRMETFPVTPNGKIDRKALPHWDGSRQVGVEYEPPCTPTQQVMTKIWEDVLRVSRPGINDNFFQLGGHSLKAILLVSRIHKQFNKEIPLAEIFNHPTIEALSSYIFRAGEAVYASVEPVEKRDYYPVSSAQNRLFVLQQMAPDHVVYNIPQTIELEGELDIKKMEQTFEELIRRHESLRTSFHIVNGAPVQRIHESAAFTIEYHDLSCSLTPDPLPLISQFVRPFDLSRAPLLRVGLITLNKGKSILMVDIHHIISDAYSHGVLTEDFQRLNSGEELSLLRLQYKDFSQWQNSRKETSDLKQQETWWLRELSGELPVLNMPIDYPRPAVYNFEGDAVMFEIGTAETRELKQLARSQGSTMYILLLALYNILLSRLTGQEDIIIGTPIVGRRHADLERIIGMFVNTLVLRNFPRGEKFFPDFLREVSSRSLAAFENQEYSFEDLVDKVDVEKDTSRNPLFDVCFSFLDTDAEARETSDTGEYRYENKTTKFDMTLYSFVMGDRISCILEYGTKLFKKETVQRFIDYFNQVVSAVVSAPRRKICDIEIISGQEKKRILLDLNDTHTGYPAGKNLHRLFEEQARRTPDAAAVHLTHRTHRTYMTYNQLNKKSDQLAYILRSKGVEPDTITAMLVERSLEMVIGILAVLKAGGAYLPIDPEYPEERIQYMLADSGARVLLSEVSKVSKVSRDIEVIDLIKIIGPIGPIGPILNGLPTHPTHLTHLTHPTHLCYIIYTSGSTGRPKGVMIEHGNVVRLLFNDKFQFDFNRGDVWTLFHSYSFDFSVWEMYGALLYGGRLVIIPRMTAKDPKQFLDLLIEQQVTVLNQTPSAFYNLIRQELQNREKQLHLKYVIFGGEALGPGKLAKWLDRYPDTKLINMFGITETCVHVTYKEITRTEVASNTSNIGKPIPTTITYILDRHRKLQPVGLTGELCVGGKGVGRGYLNRPELTAEKFIQNPFAQNRLYCSGDLGKFINTGDMEYLGRMDHQVQVRGFRIELGEIETQLLSHAHVSDAVVVARQSNREDTGDSHFYLCAYIVPGHGAASVEDLREHLSRSLPEYMVPNYFVTIKEIPLTPNGKVDRKRLPEPAAPGEAGRFMPPTSPVETQLKDIWQTVLNLKNVSVTGNYFSLGGDSIKAIRLINAVNNRFDSNLGVVDLYLYQTIKTLARHLEAGGTPGGAPQFKEALEEIEQFKATLASDLEELGADKIEAVYPMTDIEKGMFFYYLKDAHTAVYHDQASYPLTYKNPFDLQRAKRALGFLIEKHPILRSAYILDKSARVVYKPEHMDPDVHYADLSGMEWEEQIRWLMNYTENSRKRTFVPSRPPLWRLGYFVVADRILVVIIEFHHTVLDGWSNASFLTELNNTYLRLETDPQYVPEKLRYTYGEYMAAQLVHNKQLKNSPGTIRYWNEELREYKRLIFPPTETPGQVKMKTSDLGFDLRKKLRDVAGRYGTRLKHLCFAAYIYMLNMLSTDSDVVAGLVTNTRPEIEDSDKILGCFLNTVPVRIKFPSRVTWVEYIRLIERKMVELKKHDKISLFEIMEITGEKSAEENPFFDTFFNFIDFHAYDHMQRDITEDVQFQGIEHITHEKTNTLFDFGISSTTAAFSLILGYSNRFVSDDTADQLCSYFKRVLDIFIHQPETLVRKDQLLSPEEREQLLIHFNSTDADYPGEKAIHQLFEEQAARTGDRIAVVSMEHGAWSMGSYLTYRELNKRANQLAHVLRNKGVVPGIIVGIMVERSLEMIIGIFAILKAGGAYLPIDPAYPEEHIRYILADSGARVLLSKVSKVSEGIDLIKIIGPIGPIGPIKHGLPAQPCYVIYTSGSTGRPKGVIIEHCSAVNVLSYLFRKYPFAEIDTYLLKTSYTFDVSVSELFGWFWGGGRLVLLEPGGEKDPQSIIDTVGRFHVTHINFVPSMFHAFVEALNPQNIEKILCLKFIFLAGEALPPHLVDRFREFNTTIPLENIYGPTEGTVYASGYSLSQWRGGTTVPIGQPVQNVRLYILDKYDNFQPIGVAGELCITGKGVARGYLNRPELTTERFSPAERPLSFSASQLLSFSLYRTGDLARWLPDGNIEFLGRMDHQVKVRGFRIELGEIESRLMEHDLIKEAVVIDRKEESGETSLCGYIVSREEIAVSVLREYLSGRLPGYMIPSHFVRLDRMPLTPSGKVDRKELPGPTALTGKEYIAPSDEIEEQLAALWSEVLYIPGDQISAAANFFELGGHSLKATILALRIHKAFAVKIPLALIFKLTTIRKMSRYIKTSAEDKYSVVEAAENKEYYVLSSAQQRLYILQQMETGNTVYNMPQVVPLEVLDARLDKERLAGTFKKLIRRHESLRTSFLVIDGEPVQKIHKDVAWSMEHGAWDRDSFHAPCPMPHASFVRPFDLSQAALLRVGLIKVEGEKYVLMVDMHHIISDGFSQEILVKEFMAIYRGDSLIPLRLQYKDYAEWQNRKGQWERLQQQEQYWLGRLAGELPVLNLPYDYSRPEVQSFAGRHKDFSIGGKETAGLNAVAAAQEVTLYMVLMALFNLLLSRLSGQEDIIIGSPVAGRSHADLQQIIGMFVNTLVMRNYPSGEKTFSSFLREIKESALEAFENQDYQFEDLVEKAAVVRDPGRNPVFDVVFTFQSFLEKRDDITDAAYESPSYDFETGISKFDMTLFATKVDDRLSFSIEYCTKLFKEETIERFITYFKNIISSVIKAPDQRMLDIAILSEAERQQILVDFNNTEVSYPDDKTIRQLFEQQVERTPDQIALIGFVGTRFIASETIAMTYKELNKKSNQLAGVLREKGVTSEGIVGIMVDRSIEMIIGVLGILKAGGVYLPVDPDYPEERKKYMLKEANAQLLITEETYTQQMEGETTAEIIKIENREIFKGPANNPDRVNKSDDSIYIIYTSGSTGAPKGVVVVHRNVVRLVKNTNFVQFRGGERLLQTGALEFDASTFEIWGSLLNGMSLCLVPKDDILSAVKLKEHIRRYDIATIWLTSPLFNQLSGVDVEIFAGLKNLLVGGDVLSPLHINRVRKRYPGLNIINGYGPTENTTFSTTLLIEREYNQRIPIGSPISNSTVYVVDRHDRLVPVGVTGELLVGGAGVSRGYLNNPELTAEKFNRSYRSYRSYTSYRTGDLVRWLPDPAARGAYIIEFLGRMDQQVKIRGFRIELEEIESCLLKHEWIKEAVVIDRKEESGEKYLCGYIVSDQEVELSELKEYLSGRLPAYMIPSYLVQMDSIPLTPNGKVDRRSLPMPEKGVGETYAAPTNEIEEQLAALWSGVLNIEKDRISRDADFFALGGHSLKATILTARIHQLFDVKIPLSGIFLLPTIRELGQYIKDSVEEEHIAIPEVEKKEYYRLSSAQERLYILQQMEPQSTGYNVPQVVPLNRSVDKEKLENVFRQLIDRHESLRTSFIVINDEPVQRVHDHVVFKIEYDDSHDSSSINIQDRFVRPFDLSQAPLLRVGLMEVEEGKYLLIVDMHHIISDGFSHEILFKEFVVIYGRGSLAPLRLQYKDYAEWQSCDRQMQSLKQQEQYWLERFAGELPVLNLPYDYPRPAVQSFEGTHNVFFMDTGETAALKALAAGEEVTLYMALLAASTLLVYRLSGQEDIIIGSPVAGRRHADLHPIIGMFVNTLAMRNFPAGEKTVSSFLREVKKNCLGAFENQDYPFEDLVEKVSAARDVGRNPVFDVMFSLRSVMPTETAASYDFESNIAKFDLTLAAVEAGDNITFSLEYCTGLFKEKTIERFITYFKNIISSILEKPRQKIGDIEILSEKEKRQILVDFNDTTTLYPRNKTTRELFEARVLQTPDHIAVVGPTGQNNTYMTSKQLNQTANQLANVLRSKGIGADTIVPIRVGRTVEMIIGIIAVLEAGGAYLPIDPNYPEERTRYILADSGAGILVSKVSGNVEVIDLSNVINKNVDSSAQQGRPTQLSYVIYTSGSTGRPKGVMVEHCQVVNLVYGLKERIYKHYPGHLNVALVAPFIFDASVQQVFGVLLLGHTLHIVPEETRLDGSGLIEFYKDHKIDISDGTPTHLRLMAEGVKARTVSLHVKHLIIGGEALAQKVVEAFLGIFANGVPKITNIYGPTECCVDSTSYDITGETQGMSGIEPIGKPMPNQQVYILDHSGGLQPVGVVGELVISGANVSRGYLNNPELTNSKFQRSWPPLSFSASQLLSFSFYRTGDLCRWLPEGPLGRGTYVLDFLGRIDRQVKIRGFRIELGEIENQLSKHPQVKEAVVVDRKDAGGDRYLCAYLVLDSTLSLSPGQTLPTQELKTFLLQLMPDYMVPRHYLVMEKFPLTASGKLDRRALPAPDIDLGESYAAPRDSVEKTLVELWSELLYLEKDAVSIDANFFDLGGQSLKATILTARIHKVFDVKVPLMKIFLLPTVRKLAQYIRESSKEKYAGIEPVEKKKYYVLSSAQKRLYILQQMEPKSIGYNMPQVIPLDMAVDKKKLAETFKQLIHRHESLRTFFVMVNDEPVQKIHKDVAWSMEQGAWKSDSPYANFIRPFDLSQAPLLRVGLREVEEGKYLLMVDMHHIISDGISQGILLKDFAAIYQNGEARRSSLSPLRLQYKDYAEWQNRELRGDVLKQQEHYWLERFSGELPVLNLPYDYPRPAVQSFEGGRRDFFIEKEEAAGLNALAAGEGATLYMVLLAAFNLLLARLSGQEDIIVGSPVAGRPHADLQDIIGMFVNTLSMRNYPEGRKPFHVFLEEVKKSSLEAFENQDYQFEDLVDRLSINRDIGRNPVFDVMLSLQNLVQLGPAAPDREPETRDKAESPAYDPGGRTSKFDLTLGGAEIGDRIALYIQYCVKLFKEDTIERFITYFKRMVSTVLDNPQQRIVDIEFITEAEKLKLLVDFNRTEASYPAAKNIRQLFEEQAARTPDNIAVVGVVGQHLTNRTNRTYMTYKGLNETSNQLAHRLHQKGLKPDTPDRIVGILIESVVHMVVGILAVLKAGGGYLPIESEYPAQRIAYMLKDSSAVMLLCRTYLREKVAFPGEVLCLDDDTIYSRSSDNPETPASPGSMLYTIYTSGSTGMPKGVVLTNENLVNYVTWFSKTVGITGTDRALLTSSLAFDLGYTILYPVLLNGGEFHMIPRETYLFASQLLDYIADNGITYVKMTPSLFSTIAAEPSFTSERCPLLRVVVLGGEAIIGSDVQKAFDRCKGLRIMNHYGPTESTIGSIAQFIDAERIEEYIQTPTIGYPVYNTCVYILDKYLKLVPVNVAGELFIAGQGLARGYLNRPELTAEKFIEFHRSYRSYRSYISYRTGDLARWLPDPAARGAYIIEFLGRIDHQIKIRGYRIEMGEIENHLRSHDAVKDTILMARKSREGLNYLTAYIVPNNQETADMGAIKEYLAARLPDYMIPSFFIPLGKIPVTPNNKVDRRALPEPDLEASGAYQAPADEIERKLVEIWSEVLGIDKDLLSVAANFFDLGGHSLRATVVIARVHKALNIRIPLVELFKTPFIRGLGRYIKREAKFLAHQPIESGEKKEYYPVSSAQKRLYILNRMDTGSTAYNMLAVLPLPTLPGGLDIERLQSTFARLIQRHESLRSSFHIVDEQPVQKVHDKAEFEIENYKLQMTDEAQSAASIIKNFLRPFDLSRAPLLRMGLIETGDENHLLMVDMHHIVSDGISRQVLLNEFRTLWLDKAGIEAFPPLPIQYKDFSVWQAQEEQQEALSQQEAYWLKQFQGELPVLNLPTDYPRDANFEGESVDFEIGVEETGALRKLVSAEGVTMFMALFALVNILFSKLTGQEDIVVGTPTAGRRHADLERVIGMFINTLTLRNYPSGDKTFTAFLKEVKQRALDAFENQDYPFEELVYKLGAKREVGRNPLFDIMFGLQSREVVPGAAAEEVFENNAAQEQDAEGKRKAKFDLSFVGVDNGERVFFEIEYRKRLFKKETIHRYVDYFREILSVVLADKNVKLEEIKISHDLFDRRLESPEIDFAF